MQHEQSRAAIRAVVYAAKSTEDKRHSIPEQITDAVDMIEGGDVVTLRRQDPTYDTRPWVLVEDGVYHDENFSAYSGNRAPDLDRTIDRERHRSHQRQEADDDRKER